MITGWRTTGRRGCRRRGGCARARRAGAPVRANDLLGPGDLGGGAGSFIPWIGGDRMRAKQGDQIVIDTTTLDALRRHGEVIEVIGQGEREHYRIRWQDGHESVYFPGPDARVVPAG